MQYHKTIRAIFHSRPNRFIAKVFVDGVLETVHVKNTGRCKELLVPGATVVLEVSDNPARKTKYDLIAVYKDGLGLVNMDSQAPNKVVGEWLRESDYFTDLTFVKPEYTYGASRVDFYFEYAGKKVLMEVKGCTLEREGIGYFPDAPTDRGVKHLNELAAAVADGYEAYLAFVIQMPGIETVLPNVETHKEFGEALERAVEAGVKVLYLQCEIGEDYLRIVGCKEKEL